MDDFFLTPYRPELRATWDDCVQRSKNGNFLHLRDYMDYHAHRFDERSVIVEKKGRAAAVFPCNRVDSRIISHGGLTYGGLIYGHDLHATEVLEIFRLLSECYGAGAETLVYKAIPHIFHRYPAEEDLYALFRFNARLVRRDISSVVDLGNRLKLSDSRKWVIKKARKSGVEVREGSFFPEFHSLLSSVLVKFAVSPVHSLQELEHLHAKFPKNIRLFGAFKEDRLLAVSLVYDFGTVAHTQYMANSDEGRELGALDLVLAHVTESVFSDHRYFSFGISTEHEGQCLNEGLIFQKEGFGGRGVVHDFYSLELK